MNLRTIAGVEWDKGNWPKCGKHGLSKEDIEFCLAADLTVFPNPYPVKIERRFNAVGRSQNGRKVFIVFTIRSSTEGDLIRPISARYMHAKEVARYERRQKA